jgi:hypothetical protein
MREMSDLNPLNFVRQAMERTFGDTDRDGGRNKGDK